MKKAIMSVLLAVILLVAAVLPTYAIAAEQPITVQNADGSTVVYFADGSYVTISAAIVVENETVTYANTKTTSGQKEITYTDDNGNVDWTYTLSATFVYTYGTSSTCTSASYTKTINDGGWSFSDGSATKSGNTAYGKGKFTFKVLFTTVRTYTIDASISCDNNGHIS